jgi:F0F1-type ATP synthase membrane subunit b/b'
MQGLGINVGSLIAQAIAFFILVALVVLAWFAFRALLKVAKARKP